MTNQKKPLNWRVLIGFSVGLGVLGLIYFAKLNDYIMAHHCYGSVLYGDFESCEQLNNYKLGLLLIFLGFVSSLAAGVAKLVKSSWRNN